MTAGHLIALVLAAAALWALLLRAHQRGRLSTNDQNDSVRHGRVVSYRVNAHPPLGTGTWHVLTLEDGWELRIHSDQPVIIAKPWSR